MVSLPKCEPHTYFYFYCDRRLMLLGPGFRQMLFVYNGIIWVEYAAFSAKVEIWLQKKMFEKILSLPIKQIDRRFSGEWITRLNSDIQAAFTMMNGPLNIPHLVVAVINTMLSCFLMLKSSWLF